MGTIPLLINWDTFGDLRIRDFNKKWHERVTDYMLNGDFYNNQIYEALEMYQNPDNERMYRKYLHQILKYDCSLVIVDDDEKIHGVALCTWMTEDWHSWSDLEACQIKCELTTLHNYLRALFMKHHSNDECPEPFDTFHLFEYCLDPDLYENEEFMKKFFDVICNVASHMHMTRVSFFAKADRENKDLLNAQFNVISESIYSLYVEDGMRPFAKLRDIDELFATYYDRPVEPIVPYTEMPGFEEVLAAMEAARLKALQMDQEAGH